MSDAFNCIKASVIISRAQRYVEESVEHGIECFILSCVGMVRYVMYNSDCGGGYSVYIENVLLPEFMMVILRKFILLFSSVSSVIFSFGWNLLMYWRNCLVYMLFRFYLSNTSSKYLNHC